MANSNIDVPIVNGSVKYTATIALGDQHTLRFFDTAGNMKAPPMTLTVTGTSLIATISATCSPDAHSSANFQTVNGGSVSGDVPPFQFLTPVTGVIVANGSGANSLVVDIIG